MDLSLKSVAFAALLALGGCASSDTASRIGEAASAPLGDLNITRTDIAPVLLAAQRQPYAMPAALECAALAREIGALDDALGADLDAPAPAADSSLMARAAGAATDHAVGALRRTAEGLVPFRGWIRKLSGAERHAQEVTACAMAGAVRRAFLKGIAASRGCDWNGAAAQPGLARVRQ